MEYCPVCGGKNEEYTYSIKINEIKSEIEKSNYYDLKSKKETLYLESNKIKCPACGNKNYMGSEFCDECRTSLKDYEEDEATFYDVCPNCGAIAQKGDSFCAECGSKIKHIVYY